MSSIAATDLLAQALRASALGPFFPEQEFGTLFGLSREEVLAAAERLGSSACASGELVRAAVAGAVNNLTGYPHGQEQLLPQWLSASASELEAAYRAWLVQNGA